MTKFYPRDKEKAGITYADSVIGTAEAPPIFRQEKNPSEIPRKERENRRKLKKKNDSEKENRVL